MRNYYIGIGILILFSIILAGIVFTLIGSPITQRAKQLDATRLSDFASIQSGIESYYLAHKRLPINLVKIQTSYTNISTKDPETHKLYGYRIKTATSYVLCTKFSTNDQSGKKSPYPIYPQNPTKHKKGYDCLTYSLPAYLIPTPTISYGSSFVPTSTIAPAQKTKTTTSYHATQSDYNKYNAESAIIAPTKGEILCLGKKYTIKWKVPADDTQGITLKIGLPADGNTVHAIGSFPSMYNSTKQGYGSFTWVVGYNTDHVRLTPGPAYHIFFTGTYKGVQLFADSPLFTIDTCTKNH